MITNQTAFGYHSRQKEKNWVFCRKSEGTVNLQLSDYIFFIAKGDLPRPIVGYAQVGEVGSMKIIDIWNKYGEKTSCQNIATLETRLDKDRDKKVGYYEITNVKYTNKARTVTDTEIGFAKDIQVGKFISKEQTYALLSYFNTGNRDEMEKYFPNKR
ncbi:MAG: hypothetical protein UR23_C0009G0006 [Candidatus Roizmanbacteria bacterium GW2011_GWA2_32_13]|uniref:Uncharacterized protein n=1 Tax=Candidatus Roizmanbacteria bacterium GW2011_GWA2_32_13 TaxID=1618475 RepID=A0A0F9ZDW9_9BACT|nr:MAG: hypothetical protein UR23_C0009G0006 [Candidatus Roizmanbacteria bacterium GW2011_GWA2_32_13]